MPQRRLLIDLENVPTSDYTLLPDDFQIMVFVGKTQTSGLLAMINMAKIWGERLDVCQVSDTGNNALDMHLAFHLGRLACENPKDKFVILAKDKDYDPLVKHLISLEIQCRRIDSLTKLHPELQLTKTPEQKIIDPALNPVSASVGSETPYKRVYDNLQKMKGRPATRTALVAHVQSLCKQGVSAQERTKIMDRLFQDKVVCEQNTKLTYHFPNEEKL